MTNEDLMKRVAMFLDNELDKDEQKNLLLEIEKNEQFQSLLNREQSFKTYVKSHISRRIVSPALIQSIKEKITVSPS